jgi:hypothetical protein
MENEAKKDVKSLLYKILSGLLIFIVNTWIIWGMLYLAYRSGRHNAINSSHKTVGVIYEVKQGNRGFYMSVLYYINNKTYKHPVGAVNYGPVTNGNKPLNERIGLKFVVSYLPENPGEYYYVHTDSIITDAFPNKNSPKWERVDSLYRIYQKTR